MDLSLLAEPSVLFTVASVMAVAVALTLAVHRTMAAPAKRSNFNEALSYVMTSELDIDTALNRTEKKSKSWFEYWAELTARSGKVVTEPSGPGRIAITVTGLGLAVGWFMVGGPIGGVAVAAAFLVGYRAWLGMEAKKRVVGMEKQLPNLLSALRANLQAGNTPQQALLAVADDIPAPLGDELRILKRDLNVNVTLEVALKSLAARVPSREMQFLVASVEIAVRSGADLDPQLETIQEIVQQRTRIRQKLRAAIAQVKPTQFLALAAVPGMLAVSMRSAENREYWLGAGLWVLIGAAVLYGLGYYVIRIMVKGVENA